MVNEETAWQAMCAAYIIVRAGLLMGIAIVYWFVKRWINEWMEK